MVNENNLSDVELWQKAEDECLEYEGYCNKIRKGLEDLDEKSSERALWELVQNAHDMSTEARIKIELTDKNIIFSHHGKPFDYTSFRALVKQDSSKDRNATALSTTAAIVLHGSRNGWEYWLSEDGVQLGQVEGIRKNNE